MALIALSHVSHHFGGPLILDDVTLDVERGQKIGVIGQNGTGKSTILKLMRGALEASAGEVIRTRGLVIGYQEQELIRPEGTTVRDEMKNLFKEELGRQDRLRALEERLAHAADGDHNSLLAEYERLQHLDEVDRGWDVERRIASVLTGLGLPESAWDQPVSEFSGGEKNIIGLAAILLSNADLILLDEPSNHLDMDGIEWFIRWLRASRATVVMVSHNRHLLDLTVGTIWEVHRSKVNTWTGNYTDFQEQKSQALDLQERQFKNQQRLIKRLEFQARRLKDMARAYDDPGQAKRAKAMERRLEQMEVIDAPDRGEQRFKASLSGGARHGDLALRIHDWSFSYGDRVLFDHANLELTFGQRVCLVGPNGSGKTTLFRTIQEQGSWENPTIRLGASVKLGDYNQIHADILDHNESLLDWLMDQTGLLTTPASNLLHRFLFTREDLDRPIGTLSGGEKSRLQIARLVHHQVNFLMLDEPTNHLDIQASEELEGMLEDFRGTLLIISHDQYFLDQIVDTVIELKDRKLKPFMGSFQAWWDQRQKEVEERGGGTLTLHSRKSANVKEKPGRSPQEEREARKSRERERRRKIRQVEQLESRVGELEERKTQLTVAIEEAYGPGGDPERGAKLAVELDALVAELDQAIKEWEEKAELLEDE